MPRLHLLTGPAEAVHDRCGLRAPRPAACTLACRQMFVATLVRHLLPSANSVPPFPSCCADFFTLGVQFVSELRITMRRLGDFLSLPEPPEPWHARAKPAAAASNGSAAAVSSSKLGWRRSSEAARRPSADSRHGPVNGHGANGAAITNGHAAAAEQPAGATKDGPVVEVSGADFDWADRSWAQPAGAAAGSQPAAAAAAAPTPAVAADSAETELAAAPAAEAAPGGAAVAIDAAPSSPKADGNSVPAAGFQLKDLQFGVSKGQLVGIVGAVGSGECFCDFAHACVQGSRLACACTSRSGSRCGEEQSLELPADRLMSLWTTVPRHLTGKSSVLSVLLGELQPTWQAGGAAQVRPPVSLHGSVAYCSQVPWIVSGSLKVGGSEAAGSSGLLAPSPNCSAGRMRGPCTAAAGSTCGALSGESFRALWGERCNDIAIHCSIRASLLQENVLFGKPYDADRYGAVLQACALEGEKHWHRRRSS